MESVCIVHDRKSLSKFHGTVNQLRQLNEFNLSVLQQLPKRCCSCDGKNGESTFTIDRLRELCHEIQLSKNLPSTVPSPPVKPIHYVVLEFSPTLTPIQRLYKGGRFVGRDGKYLQLLERTLNIRLNILHHKSTKFFRKTVTKLQKQKIEPHFNDLWVLITLNNDKDDLEKVKQSLRNAWNKIDVTTRAKLPKRPRSVIVQSSISSTSISGDTRWKPKKYKAKEKPKNKQNQLDELEVPPQPVVRPISMPNEIKKYQKNKIRK